MFQLDAIDTGPAFGGQNVLETFEMAIRHNRRTTRTELERVFCRCIYFHVRSKVFFWPSYGERSPPSPPWTRHCLDRCTEGGNFDQPESRWSGLVLRLFVCPLMFVTSSRPPCRTKCRLTFAPRTSAPVCLTLEEGSQLFTSATLCYRLGWVESRFFSFLVGWVGLGPL